MGNDVKPVASGKKVCSGCGTVNEASSVYCYKCGVRLPAEILREAETIGIPAGFWIRLGAFLIDQIILSIIGFVIILSLSGLSLWETQEQISGPDSPFFWREFWITLGLEALYFTVAIGRWCKTIGKVLLQIKVVRMDGARVSYARSFARYLAYYPSRITLGLGFLVIALNPQKRGIHDFVCDTRVVRG